MAADGPGLPPAQRTLLDHARRFSELMHGAALLYNHALAVAHEHEVREADYRARLGTWADDEARADRGSAALSDTWVLLAEIGSPTRAFVEDWFRLTDEPARVRNDSGAVDRIRERERQVKGRQARLSFDAARETWRGAAGAGQLEYRWASTQRQLLDIVNADVT